LKILVRGEHRHARLSFLSIWILELNIA